jgi:hypothetical protein
MIILLVGIAVGIAVPVVSSHISHWLTAVVVLIVLVVVLAQGGYRVWRETDDARRHAEDALTAGDRSAQARSVTVTSQRSGLWDAGDTKTVTIRVFNQSDATIYGIQLWWADQGTDQPSSAFPTAQLDSLLKSTDGQKSWQAPSDVDLSRLTAVARFRDAHGATWELSENGQPKEIPA